jgi:hypothetical protein
MLEQAVKCVEVNCLSLALTTGTGLFLFHLSNIAALMWIAGNA